MSLKQLQNDFLNHILNCPGSIESDNAFLNLLKDEGKIKPEQRSMQKTSLL